MQFKIIYGRSGTGKTTYIYNEIKEKIKSQNKIYIIVPEQFSYSAENKLLTTIEGNSSINAEVLTLSRMADRVITETIGNNKVHLSKIGKSMIIYEALEQLKGKMNFLRNTDKNLELSIRMITEFKKHNIDPSILNEALEKIENKYLKLKIQDSKQILEKYQEKIENNYIDEADSLEILSENIEKVPFFNDAIIYIDEFAGFTPNEYKIIEKLSTLAKEITITICTDSLQKVENIEQSIYYFNQITAEKIIEIAKRNGCHIDKINLTEAKRYKNEELKILEKNIYSSQKSAQKMKNDNISLFIAKNPYSECENVAKKILELIKQKNYRYKDIAVVSGNMETYAGNIKAIFEKYNIPIFIDEKKDINNNILMKHIISLLNIFTTNFSYEAMFSYIKSGILEIEEEEIFQLENYINKWGIRGNKWYKSDFEYEEKNDLQDKINETRKKIMTPIIKFKNQLTGEKTAKEITNNLYKFIEENKIQEKLLEKADELEKKGQIEIAEEYRSGIEIFFNVLDEIYMIFEDEKMTFDKYNKILQIGITKSELGKIPTSFDQVLFGDIDRSKTKEIKALFLIGMNDGIIPNIIKDEGFLNDVDRENLRNNNIEIAKSTVEQLYENQYNIYKTLTMPEEKLYLSYPVTDKESKALRGSILLVQIKNIFPNLPEESDVINSQQTITTKQATLDTAIQKYKQYIDSQEIEEEWKEILIWYKKNQEKRLKRILKGIKYNNLPDKITENNIQKMYGKVIRTSVSRLEQYRRCPFSFHLKYGLKLKEKEEFKIKSIDTGNLMHEVIDEVFLKIEDNQLEIKNITDESLRKIIEEIINQKLQMSKNYIFTSSPKFIILTKRLKKVVFESIKYIIQQLKNSKFELYGHEIEFNEKSELKPMKMTLESGNQVIITGKIDRVDIAKTGEDKYVRIIDYKSSVKDINLNQVISGIQIQLLTYLDEISEQENLKSAGILYFNLLDTIIKADKNLSDEEIRKQLNKKFKMRGLVVADVDIVKMMDQKLQPSTYSESIPVYLDRNGEISKGKSSVLDKEKFENLQKYTKHIIKEITNEIFKGKINIEPYYMNKKTACEYCEYKTICNFNPKFKQNEYRYIKNKTTEEVLEEITKINDKN